MGAADLSFALNHMCAPRLGVRRFFELARAVGVDAVEIRNDLPEDASIAALHPERLRALAAERGLRILSINALQRFDDWCEARMAQARALIAYAAACGAEAIVLVPVNGGPEPVNGERQADLRAALAQLQPLLADAGVIGLVEPLGFATCSVRLKSAAADAIRSLQAQDVFRIVHDTFHHHVAGEAAVFPELTGLVHVSGVADRAVETAGMRDAHRVLVDADDRLDTVGQIAALRGRGAAAPLSLEPFAEAVHALVDPAPALRRTIDFLRAGVAKVAA